MNRKFIIDHIRENYCQYGIETKYDETFSAIVKVLLTTQSSLDIVILKQLKKNIERWFERNYYWSIRQLAPDEVTRVGWFRSKYKISYQIFDTRSEAVAYSQSQYKLTCEAWLRIIDRELKSMYDAFHELCAKYGVSRPPKESDFQQKDANAV